MGRGRERERERERERDSFIQQRTPGAARSEDSRSYFERASVREEWLSRPDFWHRRREEMRD